MSIPLEMGRMGPEIANDRTSFHRQYDTPEAVEVAEGSLEIYHATPEHRTNDSPILLGHGHPANPTGMAENLYQLYSQGWEVLFPYTPDGIKIDSEIEQSKLKPVNEQAKVVLKEASAYLKVIDEEELENINGVAYSKGALPVITVAKMRPRKFKNIVLINPSGIMGKTGFLEFAAGGVKHKLQEKRKMDEAITTGRYLRPGVLDEREAPDHSESPSLVTDLKTKWAIPKADILDALAELERQGIGIRIIHTKGDKIYPLAKVQKMLKDKGLEHMLQVEDGDHTSFSGNPKKFGELINSAIVDLDKRKQQQAA